jgi:diadenosine tetraphosphatase ApaH/serine/threonine PP2A family protein phosphatase
VPAFLELPESQPLAIFSDTHANLTALEAVLADIKNRGIKHMVMLGDVAGKGPRPAQVLDRLRELQIPCLFGNWDELLIRPLLTDPPPEMPSMTTALAWQRQEVGLERLEWLKSLPFALDVPRKNGLIRLVHASSEGVWTRVRENDPLEHFYGLFAATKAVGLDAPTPMAVGYGDIHTVLVRHLRSFPEINPSLRGRLIFNVGSVGNPLDSNLPSYAVLHGFDQTEISFIRVPYDFELECSVAIQTQMPQLEEYIEETRTGMYRPRGI